MAQVFKLFCFAISALLFLQLADAKKSEESSNEDDTNSNGEDGEEQKPTFLKTIDNIKESRPVVMAKKLSNIAGTHINKFKKDFVYKLKEETKKQVNDENSLLPNAITNNLILPAKAAVQAGIDTIKEPVTNILSDIQQTYADELTKSEQKKDYVPLIGTYTQKANKPVALLKASKNIVGNTVGSLFGKASSLWNSIKTPAEKSENEDTKIKVN